MNLIYNLKHQQQINSTCTHFHLNIFPSRLHIAKLLIATSLTLSLIFLNPFLTINISASSSSLSPLESNLTTLSILGFTGKVTDLCSEEPIAGAEISIESLGLSTITNSQGKYQLKVPHGNYEVSSQAAGYINMSVTLQKTTSTPNPNPTADTNSLTTLNFEMIPLNVTPEQEEIIEKKLGVPPPRSSSNFTSTFPHPSDTLTPSKITTLPSTITVLMPDGQVELMDMDEYLKGVIPKEMPAGWPKEALKAQSVAARCYAATHPNKWNHPQADVCTNPNCCQAWSPLHYATTDQAVTETTNIIATYKSNIIQAYYFSHCDGHTRNIEDVWEVALPYCRSVPCICGYTILYAHGVGMCQQGAKAMANQGDNFQEILCHYYTGIAVTTTAAPDTLILGDFGSANNGPPDGVVDLEDLMIFTQAYDSTPDDYNWNPICDIAGPNGGLNPDGVIDFEDLMVFAMNYGKTQADKISLKNKSNKR